MGEAREKEEKCALRRKNRLFAGIKKKNLADGAARAKTSPLTPAHPCRPRAGPVRAARALKFTAESRGEVLSVLDREFNMHGVPTRQVPDQ